MRFKTDENLPVEVADLLRQEGHDALGVADQQLAGHSDPKLAEVIRMERRALITLDLDFSDIRSYPPSDYFGIIVLRPALQSVSAILRVMTRVVAMLATEPLTGTLWIVEEHQVRIREGGRPA